MNIIADIVERSMREMAIYHARERMIEINGEVNEEQINSLKTLTDSKELWSIVCLLYGEPKRGPK